MTRRTNPTRFAACMLVSVLVASAASVARAAEYEHEFKYKPEGNPKQVHVAGDFNGWNREATPMVKGGDNVWAARVKLNEGLVHYKFVVDGDKWVSDPNADKSLEVDDGHGGKNSAVMVGPGGQKLPPPEKNHIRAEALTLEHSAYAEGAVLLLLTTQADDVESVSVKYNAGGAEWKTVPLHKVETKHGLDRWGTAVTNIKAPMLQYIYVLKDGTATFFRNEFGLVHPYPDAKLEGGITAPLKSKFDVPDWAKTAVWYQIFPERFRNGEKSNDPGDKEYERLIPWTHNWWTAAPNEAPGDENFYKGQGNVWKRRYGGDVQGLIESLPYLRKLGITAIYLNPIFEGDSMHKYDTSDFRHVDDNFGFKGDIAQLSGETDDPKTWKWTKSDLLFLEFVDKAHQMGFKVICDGVFNHVGKSHPFFQDVLKNGKKSRYADWFEIRDWNPPIKYIAWDTGGEATTDGHLPVFKKDPKRGLAPGPYAHVMGITKRWLAPDGDPKRGIDGWRLDVPGDIPHPFWVEWRKTVKGAKPDAYITGEIWTWAQPWLRGDQFDAVMNYRWADAAQAFFVNQQTAIKPSDFGQRLNAIAYTYPYQVALANQNLFDSHDTDRFASMFVNPDLPYDAKNRLQDNGPQYKKDKPTPEQWQRMRQAVAAQMAFVGAPMTYYGNEAGMWSPDDPSNRMPMVWEGMTFDDPEVKFDPQQFAWYQRTIAVRQKLPELQLGFFRGLVAEDDQGVYAFARELGERQAVIVINRSNEERQVRVPAEGLEGAKLVDWLDEASTRLVQSEQTRPTIEMKPDAKSVAVSGGSFTITLKPFSTAVLAKQ